MLIRPASSQDFNEWLRLRQALWPDCSHAEQLAEMADIQRDSSQSVFVIERLEGGLGGFLEVSLHPIADGCTTQPIGYIEGWYVDEDLRQKGLGGQLVAAAEAWARQKGCQEMASDCLVDNTVSLAAHLALGYTEESRLIHFRKWLSGGGS